MVSNNGTALPTNKDFNLVDANKQNGDWLQIHSTHTDFKGGAGTHTHFPKINNRNTTREIKQTDGADLDRADRSLRDGSLRERRNRKDRGG